MGSINYRRGKYITIGMDCNYDYDEYEDDGFSFLCEDMYSRIKEIIGDYSFSNWKVNIENGYYEGFYVEIEDYFDWCLDNYRQRLEMHKEITQLKEMMLRLIDEGLCSVYPGWCTGYADYKQSKKDVAEAVKKMRNEVNKLMTFNQYKRSGKTFQEMFI